MITEGERPAVSLNSIVAIKRRDDNSWMKIYGQNIQGAAEVVLVGVENALLDDRQVCKKAFSIAVWQEIRMRPFRHDRQPGMWWSDHHKKLAARVFALRNLKKSTSADRNLNYVEFETRPRNVNY